MRRLRQLPAVRVNRSRIAQHVRMRLEADLDRDAGALDQLAEASDCERCALSVTKVKAASVSAAPAIHVPEQSESYTQSPSAAN
jgi:hypothetical protein